MLTSCLIRAKLLIGVLIVMCCCRQAVTAQINFTANDAGRVPSYANSFLYGVNGGFYYSWDDQSLADIAAGNPAKGIKGAGIKTLRLFLPDSFLIQYNYDIRLDAFGYYASLGIKDNTVVLGGDATVGHRDSGYYQGCNQRALEFKNLYEPIWDYSGSGTPVNKNNYFATYIYEVVRRYKPYVKFWEIVNEPDMTGAAESWYNPTQPGNWWRNNPTACQLTNMYIPIYYYIRMLRIAYEVIKYLDPNAYVAPGGIAFPSFLDVLLRNTDNPVDGTATWEYPNTGGAFFDVISYHSYPMYDLRNYQQVNGVWQWVYSRHSDAAVDDVVKLKDQMDSVQMTRGYNNVTYPKKMFIVTETNLPSQATDWLLGSPDAQKNYLAKVMIRSQQHDLKQVYVFELGNVINSWETAVRIHDVMGLYDKLPGIGPINALGENTGVYRQQYTSGGVAFKTCSDALNGLHYNADRTAQMSLPPEVAGVTFTSDAGQNTYVLWARTSTDNSEVASAVYSFPDAMNVSPLLQKKSWDYTTTGLVSPIGSSGIVLTGEPIYLTETLSPLPLHNPDSLRNEVRPDRKFGVSLYPNPASSVASLQFTLTSPATVNVNVYDATGKWVMKVVNAEKFATGQHNIPVHVAGQLSPGVYYFRFDTNTRQVMKKLVIVK